MSLRVIFDNPDFLYPLAAGVAIAAACALLSVLVVLKRLAFITQGIAHAGFGGVGVAAFLALDPRGIAYNAVVFAFCLGTGLVIGWLSRSRRVMVDTAIGILLAAGMALGFLLDQLRLHLEAGWYEALVGDRAVVRTPWESVLFGDILFVERSAMWLAIALSLATIVLLAIMLKEILFYAFDETVSQVFGVPAGAIHYLMLTLLAIVIVMSMKLVGLILVSALLVIPGATATLLSRRLGTVLALSVVVAEVGVIGGYLLSFGALRGNLSTGPLIVLVLAVEFALALAWGRLARR